jgi:hypothetical protein
MITSTLNVKAFKSFKPPGFFKMTLQQAETATFRDKTTVIQWPPWGGHPLPARPLRGIAARKASGYRL